MSGGGGRQSKYTTLQQLLLEVVKQYGVGQGYKRRRSDYPQSSPTHPSFITTLQLKRDSRTKQLTQGGEITIPPYIRNNFSGAKAGDSFQIRISNLQNQKILNHPFALDSRGRIFITQRQCRYLNYQQDVPLRIQFTKHYSQQLISQIGSVTALGSFSCRPNNGNIILINLPKNVKNILQLNEYTKPGKIVHWTALGRQGTGVQYPSTQIGIKPLQIGLPLVEHSFVAQITIINANLTPHEALKLDDASRVQFYKERLQPIHEATNVRLTGKEQQDKPEFLVYILDTLIKNNQLENFMSFEREKSISTPTGKKRRLDLLFSCYGSDEKKIGEIKAVAAQERVDDLTQFLDYKESGLKLYLFTTANKKDIQREIQEIVDRIYAYEDLKKMVEKLEDPYAEEMLELIRLHWS